MVGWMGWRWSWWGPSTSLADASYAQGERSSTPFALSLGRRPKSKGMPRLQPAFLFQEPPGSIAPRGELLRFDHGDLRRFDLADAANRRAVHVLDQRWRHGVRARRHRAHQVEHAGLDAAAEVQRGGVPVVAVFLVHDLRGGGVLVQLDAIDHHAGPRLRAAEVEVLHFQPARQQV